MKERFREMTGFDVEELAGAQVAGEIPLPYPLINRLIAERLKEGKAPVAAAVVEPRTEGAVTAHVRMNAGFIPPLVADVRVEQQPSFPESPVLVLRWSLRRLGALARLASPALAFAGVLPPGVRLDGDLIGIDVAEVLRSKGHGDLLPFIGALRVRPTERAVMVQFEVRA